LVEAENAKKESFARLIESEQQRLKAYSDAEIIIKNAQGESNYHFDNIVKQAQDDAEQIKRSAKNEIKDYKKNLEVDNNKKIIDIAFLASEKIIKKNINLKDNKKIINDFVKQQTTRKENN
jgi:F-type H+-transporting ATPase subunit b